MLPPFFKFNYHVPWYTSLQKVHIFFFLIPQKKKRILKFWLPYYYVTVLVLTEYLNCQYRISLDYKSTGSKCFNLYIHYVLVQWSLSKLNPLRTNIFIQNIQVKLAYITYIGTTGSPVFSINKTGRHHIYVAEILLKVALNTITQPY